jgi:hypothetical protein
MVFVHLELGDALNSLGEGCSAGDMRRVDLMLSQSSANEW